MNSVLSANQNRLLAALGKERMIADSFYLTGGTALAEYYLKHRYSEDLDFFSEQEFDPQSISILLKKLQKPLRISKITYEQSFNRNLFLLELPDDSIKTEFTYFPFPKIETGERRNGILVDSLLDIAVNKFFTIHQKPRARDFIDLYCILQKQKEWTIDELARKAQAKFDHYLDPLQLAAQFTKVMELKDYPRMIAALPEKDWQDFFLASAKALTKQSLA